MSVLVLLSTPKALMFKILPSKLAYTPNSWFPTSIPSAFTKIPLTFSLCLFILTSFTTMLLCVYPSAFLPQSGCRWHGPPPILSIPPHSLIHTCGQAQLQQYKHTERLHSYTPCACCCLVCLASATDF